MGKFYVYIYLDPRKLGYYEYSGVVFDFAPFYVGKGSGVRWYPSVHVDRPHSAYLTNKLKKIGLDAVVKLKLIEDLSEIDAFLFERLYIKIIGRQYSITGGPLVNFTLGGSGASPSEETRKKISKTLKSKALQAWNKGKPWSAEVRKKMSKSAEGRLSPIKGKRYTEEEKLSKFHRGEDNARAKLSVNAVLLIRKLYLTGEYFQRELAEQFGVAQTIISRIVCRKVWTHI